MAALLRSENLSRWFGDLCAVQDISLRLDRGEIVGFLGPNGAGKSTTMRLLCGVLAPSSGSVRLNGIDLSKDPVRAKAALGYLPERPPLYGDLTVDEYLEFCSRLRQVPRDRQASALRRVKKLCGLQQAGGRLIGNLSTGFRQRVGIAQAVVHRPRLVVLDEPTAGLDPNQIGEIRNLIGELGQDHGVLLSSHILPEVQAVCDRVLIINQGKAVFSGKLDQLQQQDPADRLILELENPPSADRLGQLPGVAAVEPLAPRRFRLRLQAGADRAEIAARLIVDGYRLLELHPERQDLEQIFVRLTAGEQPR